MSIVKLRQNIISQKTVKNGTVKSHDRYSIGIKTVITFHERFERTNKLERMRNYIKKGEHKRSQTYSGKTINWGNKKTREKTHETSKEKKKKGKPKDHCRRKVKEKRQTERTLPRSQFYNRVSPKGNGRDVQGSGEDINRPIFSDTGFVVKV